MTERIQIDRMPVDFSVFSTRASRPGTPGPAGGRARRGSTVMTGHETVAEIMTRAPRTIDRNQSLELADQLVEGPWDGPGC